MDLPEQLLVSVLRLIENDARLMLRTLSTGAMHALGSVYYLVRERPLRVFVPDHADIGRLRRIRPLITGGPSQTSVVLVVRCKRLHDPAAPAALLTLPTPSDVAEIVAYLKETTTTTVSLTTVELQISDEFARTQKQKANGLRMFSAFHDWLSCVSVDNCVIKKWQLDVIFRFVPSTLRGLRLHGCMVNEPLLVRALTRLTRLVILDLGDTIGDIDFKLIAPALCTMTDMRELDLGAIPIEPIDLEPVLRAMRGLRRLRLGQSLPHCTPTLANELFTLPSLRELAISRCGIRLPVLCDTLATCTIASPIECLDLGENRIFARNSQLEYGLLFNLLTRLPNITALHLQLTYPEIPLLIASLSPLHARLECNLTIVPIDQNPILLAHTRSASGGLALKWHSAPGWTRGCSHRSAATRGLMRDLAEPQRLYFGNADSDHAVSVPFSV
jgi:hypothetical protein